nr:5-formyltetrahydrofolate cyclo-ligase [uncultured Desulfobulbus sp.]
MQGQTKQDRQKIRQDRLKLRNHLSKNERQLKDEQVQSRLLSSVAIMQFQHFFIYCSYRTEVDTSKLICQLLTMGKTVSVPLVRTQTASMDAVVLRDPSLELVAGYKGIPEPRSNLVPERLLDPRKVEVVLLPGSVFDHSGNRLGYGGGYYDRFLANQAPQALRVGLAYKLQLVELLPAQHHDIPMDFLVTESDIYSWPR